MKKIIFVTVLIMCVQPVFGQTPFWGANGKVGFKDENGNVIIPCQFNKVHESGFKEGLCAVQKKKGVFAKWGFIDISGKLVIPYKYTTVHDGFHEGLCGVWYKLIKSGYIDKSGKVVIKLDNLVFPHPFKDGKATILAYEDNRQISKVIGKDKKRISMDSSSKRSARKSASSKSPEESVLTAAELLTRLQSAKVEQEKKVTTVAPVSKEEPYLNVDQNSVKPHSELEYVTPVEGELVPKSPVKSKSPILERRTGSDVDRNIPSAIEENSNTFAVIIANENYRRETKVDFAHNDGEVFRQYCLQALGLPESNVHCVKDATLNDFRAEMDWLSQVSDAYNGEARLIVYYAGHGVPDEKTLTSYLLPVDGYSSNINTGYKLADMYSSLSAYPAKSVMVFLDACFSGAKRDGDMLASARGVARKTKPDTPKGNMVVLSAASGDETAYKYDEKSHGMFTYFLLKKLQEGGADTTLGELADYITTNVGRKSVVINMKPQTPTVSVSGELSSQWRKLTFSKM